MYTDIKCISRELATSHRSEAVIKDLCFSLLSGRLSLSETPAVIRDWIITLATTRKSAIHKNELSGKEALDSRFEFELTNVWTHARQRFGRFSVEYLLNEETIDMQLWMCIFDETAESKYITIYTSGISAFLFLSDEAGEIINALTYVKVNRIEWKTEMKNRQLNAHATSIAVQSQVGHYPYILGTTMKLWPTTLKKDAVQFTSQHAANAVSVALGLHTTGIFKKLWCQCNQQVSPGMLSQVGKVANLCAAKLVFNPSADTAVARLSVNQFKWFGCAFGAFERRASSKALYGDHRAQVIVSESGREETILTTGIQLKSVAVEEEGDQISVISVANAFSMRSECSSYLLINLED